MPTPTVSGAFGVRGVTIDGNVLRIECEFPDEPAVQHAIAIVDANRQRTVRLQFDDVDGGAEVKAVPTAVLRALAQVARVAFDEQIFPADQALARLGLETALGEVLDILGN